MINYFDRQLFDSKFGCLAKFIEDQARKKTILKVREERLKREELEKKRNSMVRRLKEEKEERAFRQKMNQEAFLERILKEEKEKSLKEIELAEQTRSFKEQVLNEKKKKIKIEKKMRNLEFVEGKKRYLLVRKQKPLYEKLEESFIANEVLPKKMEYTRSLHERRELLKSCSLDKVKEHEKKYLKDLELNKNVRSAIFRRKKLNSLLNASDKQLYKPRIRAILDAEKEEEEEKARIKEKAKKILFEKRQKYGDLVQELYLNNFSPVTPEAKLNKTTKNKLNIFAAKNDKYSFKSLNTPLFSKSKDTKPRENSREKAILSSKSVDYINYINSQKKQLLTTKVKLPAINLAKSKSHGSSDAPNHISKLKIMTKNLDHEAQRLDYLYQSNKISIHESNLVASAYLNSIQAKLALLDKTYK